MYAEITRDGSIDVDCQHLPFYIANSRGKSLQSEFVF